jgi:hypothetical protein
MDMDFAISCPLVRRSRLVSGSCPSTRTFVPCFFQTPPRGGSQKITFVDLNRDELIRTRVRANYTELDYLWLPRTVLVSDFIVSMPKIKTHHWAGVTLSMKNMFGIVPGTKYGWPKNVLHWEVQQHYLQQCRRYRRRNRSSNISYTSRE